MTEEFFTLVKLPATTHLYACRKCGAVIAPLVDGENGTKLHRRDHASVDSGATISHPGDPRE